MIQVMYCFEMGNSLNWIIEHEEAIRGWCIVFGTLLLAMMAYKQIIESRLNKRIEKHTEDLKIVFKDWHEELSIKLQEPPYIIEKPVYKIEQYPLFKDSKSHIPSEFRDFNSKWEHFKDKSEEIFQKQNEIFNKIIEKIDLNKFSPSILEQDIAQSIAQSIYLQANCLIIEKIAKKCENYQRESSLMAPLPDLYFSYKNFECKLAINSPSCQPEDVQKYHLAESKQIALDFENDILIIINLQEELNLSLEKIIQILKMLIPCPEYNHMDCKYVKRTLLSK